LTADELANDDIPVQPELLMLGGPRELLLAPMLGDLDRDRSSVENFLDALRAISSDFRIAS